MLGEVEKFLKKTCGIMLPSTHRNLDSSASEASKNFFENDQFNLYYVLNRGIHLKNLKRCLSQIHWII